MGPNHPFIVAADLGGFVLILGSAFNWLPGLAAGIAALWYLIQIWESQTVKGWRRQRAQRIASQQRFVEKGYPARGEALDRLTEEHFEREHEKHHMHPPHILRGE